MAIQTAKYHKIMALEARLTPSSLCVVAILQSVPHNAQTPPQSWVIRSARTATWTVQQAI